MLMVQLPVAFRDGARVQQAIVTGLLHALRCRVPKTLTVNATINHDMRHVHALGSELTGEGLAQ